MVASTGDPLMREDALDTIRESLLPLATIITPNLPEAGILLRKSVITKEDQEAAVDEIIIYLWRFDLSEGRSFRKH